MMRWISVCGLFSLALATRLLSQERVAWHDPSPHSAQFVTVDKDVRLEVLDWGGSGRPLVLLPGGGNTAHVFDEFAPKLTANYRVYGITRRGFGTSTYSPVESGADQLGEDVAAVIRALKLSKPVLAGHSIAGVELSAVATLHPDLIAGVIYMEAAYPYAFDNGRGPTMKEFLEVQGPQPPNPSEADLASFRALQRWDEQTYGFRMPEAEFHQTWDSTSDGRVEKPREFQGSEVFMTIMSSPKKFARIPVPALVVFAIPHVQEAWMSGSKDAGVQDAASSYFKNLDVMAEKQAKAFQEGVPGARVVRLTGMHYIFCSNESDVLREMRAFAGSLK